MRIAKPVTVICVLLLLITAFSMNSFASPRPKSSINDPIEGSVISEKTYTISGTAAVNGVNNILKVEVSLNDGPWELASGTDAWSYTCAMPAYGKCTIRSKATDTVLNEEIPGAGVTVTVDNTPPSTSITYPVYGAAVSGTTITLSGTADDGSGEGVAKVEISTDGGTNWDIATGSTLWTYDWVLPLPENYKSWRVASAMLRDGQSNETRTVRVTHLLNTGGTSVRVGFVSGPSQPITVTEAYIGNDAGGGSVSGNVLLTFGGASSVTVPAGQVLYSDPVPWNAVRGNTIVITSYGTGTSWGKSYAHASYYEDGNVAGVTRPLANMSGWNDGYDVWNALIVEVLSDGVTRDENVLLIGDSITLGLLAPHKSCKSWDRLLGGKVNVINAARSGTTAAIEAGVISGMLNRGINYDKAIVSLGTNDLTYLYTVNDIETNLCTIFSTLKSAGIKVYAGNIMARSADSEMESKRVSINNWLNTLPCGIDGVIDFDLATRDPENPDSMLPAYASPDGLHPNELGHAAMFGAIDADNLFIGGMVFDIYARATDAVGNVEDPAVTVRLTVDNDVPASVILLPVNNETLSGTTYSIWGTANDAGGSGVAAVEISTDGGSTWNTAAGATVWHYDWLLPVSGSFTLISRSTDRAGNTETGSPEVMASVVPYGSPELQHYYWDESISGGSCNFCHTLSSNFLSQSFRKEPGFCGSCHNPSGVAHEMSLYGAYEHSILVNVTSQDGYKLPTYGNITAGEYNNQPFSRLTGDNEVSCVTCHNDMRKTEDYGRTWEYTTTNDQLTYSLQWGGWDAYGYLVPKVYEDASLWPGPSYSRDRKPYLVDPSEYTYDEKAGTITFNTARQATDYIYVTLDYQYLRASSQEDRLCADCHNQVTHMSVNCLRCHRAHNTDNLAGIRRTLRTSDRSERTVVFTSYTGRGSFADGDSVYDGICEVCHTMTRYYTRDGSGFTNHSSGENYDGYNCVRCHQHSNGFSKYTTLTQGQTQGAALAASFLKEPTPLTGYSM